VNDPDTESGYLKAALECLVKGVAQFNREHDIVVPENNRLIVKGVDGTSIPLRHVVGRGSGVSWVLSDGHGTLFDECVGHLAGLRPDVVSTSGAEDAIDELLGQFADSGWRLAGLRGRVRQLVADTRRGSCDEEEVAIPVWGLAQESEELAVGKCMLLTRRKFVERHPRAAEALWSGEDSRGSSNLASVVVTRVAGCDESARRYRALCEANRSLNLIRAVAYPALGSLWLRQFGVAGAGDRGSQYAVVDDSRRLGCRSLGQFGGPGLRDFMLDERMLETLDSMGFRALSSIATSARARPYQRALATAANWMGEATKPDSMEGKLLKACFALDAMLGDESTSVPDKGQRARISERAAFLLATTYRERQRVHSDIGRLVEMRSQLAHGSALQVFDRDVVAAMKYARRILKTLVLDREFPKSDDLAKWVLGESLRG